jgi:hypothetical protein
MDNMTLWEAVAQPPREALKTIGGGRLKGMTDINPQWRYEALTKELGPCGVGWKYTIDERWERDGSEGQVHVFVNVSLFIKVGDNWSEPIPGTGGATFLAREYDRKASEFVLRSSDECFKMATTDAISVAAKMLGVGADIYAGRWDGSKYKDVSSQTEPWKDQAQQDLFGNWCSEADNNGDTIEQLGNWYKSNSAKAKAEMNEYFAKRFDKYVGELKKTLEVQ